MAPTCQALQATSWPLAGPCWRPGPCRRPPGQWQLGPHSGWGRGEWQATWEHLERTDGALGGPEVRGDEPQIWGRGRQEGGGAVGRAGGVPGVLVPGLGVGRGPSSESGKGGVTGAHARGTADAEDTDSSEAAGRRGRCQEGWGPGAPEGGGLGRIGAQGRSQRPRLDGACGLAGCRLCPDLRRGPSFLWENLVTPTPVPESGLPLVLEAASWP